MPFNQQTNKNVEVSVGSTSTTVAIDASYNQCRIYNAGPDACHIKYGLSPNPLVAADDDMVMPAGFVEVHNKGYADWVAAKCRTGKTATLHIIVGTGD